MNNDAIARLNLLGRLFIVASAAGTRLGEFLLEPHPARVEPCFTDISNYFTEAATVCDSLAMLTREQGENGIGHGYTTADSAALATFKMVLFGFGACAVQISIMDFTADALCKADCWEQAAASLRMSSEASWRQIEQMIHALPPSLLAEPISPGC